MWRQMKTFYFNIWKFYLASLVVPDLFSFPFVIFSFEKLRDFSNEKMRRKGNENFSFEKLVLEFAGEKENEKNNSVQLSN